MPFPFPAFILSNGAQRHVEPIMELQMCPICKEGKLLPMSSDEKVCQTWVCTTPTCSYTIGSSMIGVTYYKGLAGQKEIDKGDRHWTEFNF